MTDSPSPDLSRLRVFTNRGTVAYPLAASGLDPATASEHHQPDTPETEVFGFNESVSEDLRQRLGAVLFAVDSRRGVAWCYFQAQLDRPVQLTAECFGEDAADALDSLPPLVERYITEVRGGTVQTEPPSTRPNTDDARAYSALTHEDSEFQLPWSEAVLQRAIAAGPIDVTASSVVDAVHFARHIATADGFPELTVAVTKGERTDALDNVDVVIRIRDGDAFSIQNENRLRKAQLDLATDRLRQSITFAPGVLVPFLGTRGLRNHVATQITSTFAPLGIVAHSRLRYRLKMLGSGVAGIIIGLMVATWITTPYLFPTTEELLTRGRLLLTTGRSLLTARPIAPASIALAAGLVYAIQTHNLVPETKLCTQVNVTAGNLRASPWLPSGGVLRLLGVVLLLTVVVIVLSWRIWILS